MNWKRVQVWLIAANVLVALPLALTEAADLLIWHQSINYSRRLPAEVLQTVFDRPMPQGIISVQILGRSYLIKHWVWMRLKVDNAALRDMISHAYSSDQCRNFPNQSASLKYNVADKFAVNWGQIQSIKTPECYEWGTQSVEKPSAWWYGIMVVDRKRNLVFIHGAME